MDRTTKVMRTRRVLAVAAAILVGASAGCEALVGIRDRGAAHDPGRDATSDGPGTGGQADAGGCIHAFPPPAPLADDGAADMELYLALRTIDFGVHGDASVDSVGFDLDGLCTCPDPAPCAALVPATAHCDDRGGIDNGTSSLVEQLTMASHGSFNVQAYDDALSQGIGGIILRVSHYDGGANDTAVTVAIFASNGTMPAGYDGGDGWGMDGGNDMGPPIVVPRWDGNDVWTLDVSSTLQGNDGPLATPRYFDTAAYVAGGTLVAHVDFPLRLVGNDPSRGAITMLLVGAVLTGTLVPEGGSFRLDDGVSAGRWPVRDLSNALAELPDPVTGGYTCPGSSAYDQIKSLVCNAADIPADPPQTDPRYVCDALSMGMRFTAYPAKMGWRKPRAASPSPCIDAPPTETCL